MKKDQFQVGMRVIAVRRCDGKDLRGRTGTVRTIGYTAQWPIGVEFDEDFDGGNTLGGLMERNSKRGRWCDPNSLLPLDGASVDIETYGGETTVHGYINGREITATAKCAASDTPNAYVGALMSLKKAFGIEDRPAKKGEHVVVVRPRSAHGYTMGDVLQMEYQGSGINTKTGKGVRCCWEEYEVVRDPAIFQPPKCERKAVCIKAASDDSPFREGRIYTVDGDGKIDTGNGKVQTHQQEDERWIAAGKNRFIIIDEDEKEESK